MFAIDIQYTYYLLRAVEYGYDNFALRVAAASYVTGELLNVGHYLGSAFFPGSATHPLAVSYAGACKRTLEGR